MSSEQLKYCPQCGSIGYQYRDKKYWYCPVCLYTYFHNVAASASVIVEIEGSILMLVRNKDPGKGMLALPGGFVDGGERAEHAAARECREETGLEPRDLSFVGTWPNEYAYKNVTYNTCDLYFSAKIEGSLEGYKIDPEEVESFILVPPEEIEGAPIAFESARQAILAWLKIKKG